MYIWTSGDSVSKDDLTTRSRQKAINVISCSKMRSRGESGSSSTSGLEPGTESASGREKRALNWQEMVITFVSI